MPDRRDLKQARIKPGYVLDADEISEFDMSDEDRVDFREGVLLFNAGDYWESHEAWEQVWKRHSEPSRVFLQALIQTAAAYHQLNRGIYHGVVKHFRNAETKLRPFPNPFLGLQTQPVKDALIAGISEAERLGADGIGDFDPSLVVELTYDPST